MGLTSFHPVTLIANHHVVFTVTALFSFDERGAHGATSAIEITLHHMTVKML